MTDAYNATYVASDMDEVTVDFAATYLIALVGFATLIALAGLFVWFRKKGKGFMG